jgi:hypothetical protein
MKNKNWARGGGEAAASGVRAQTRESGGQAAPWIHPLHLGLYTPPSPLHVPFCSLGL